MNILYLVTTHSSKMVHSVRHDGFAENGDDKTSLSNAQKGQEFS